MFYPEGFDPHEYEAGLALLNKNGPFFVWSGKYPDSEEPQFPPNWGHHGGEKKSIFDAIAQLCELDGDPEYLPTSPIEAYFHRAYISDANGDVVLSMSNLEVIAFLHWLFTRQSGGSVGLQERHRSDE